MIASALESNYITYVFCLSYGYNSDAIERYTASHPETFLPVYNKFAWELAWELAKLIS